MRENIDELAERIAHIEAPDAPCFVGGAVFDCNAGPAHPRLGLIVDFDREIGP